ncbi:MAG: hypothetical protein SFY32_02460 [Bacteroidota bacterium]|nr:hypothetical protein [Bacteroidota bacterium]
MNIWMWNLKNSLVVGLYLLFVIVTSIQAQNSNKLDFKVIVTYLDGTTDQFNSDLYQDPDKDFYFVLKNDCDKIFAYQTKSIDLIDNRSNEKNTGFASRDSNWYFKTYGGSRLCAYSLYPGKERVRNLYFAHPDSMVMTKYNRKWLKAKLKDNDEAYKKLKNHLTLRDVQKVIQGLGILVAFGGIVSPYILPPIGVAICSTSFLLERPQKNALKKAVEGY